jgi:transmembrane sensor
MNEKLIGLIEKYLNDTLLPEEWEEFRAMIAVCSSEDMDDALGNLYEREMLPNADMEADRNAVFSAIERHIHADERDVNAGRGRIIRLRPFARFDKWPFRVALPRVAGYAAAIVIACLIGLGAYWSWISSHRSAGHALEASSAAPLAKLLPPANAGAVLTLANGSRILLTGHSAKAAGGLQELKIIRLDSGVVDYHAIGASGSARDVEFNTLTTSRGMQYQVILPDGSHVWLNSASSIRYPIAFPAGKREVELTGEAYFEVSPDKQRPFTVKANNMEVDVLGTAFNVMAYSDETTLRTTLFHGSVSVQAAGKSLQLKPGEQAGLAIGNQTLSVHEANLDEVAAWRRGMFLFKKQKIEEIMRQISRWYDVEIEYRGKRPEVELSGELSRRDDAFELLEILQSTNNVHFTMEGNKIIVTQ